MDTLTHIMTGLAVGQLFSDKKESPRFRPLLWGAVAANIPDLDTVFQLFLSTENSMLFHRGISHSLFLWILCSPLLALCINKIYKGNRYTCRKWLKISVIAWFLHILMDIFNTYGTGIFEPFSHLRVAYDAVNVIDLFVLIPLLVMVIMFVCAVKDYAKKTMTALAVVMYPLLYICAAVFIKMEVEYKGEIQLINQHIFPDRVITSPLPLSPLAWKVVAETEEGYYTGVFYGFWKEQTKYTYMPKNKFLESKYLFNPKYRQLKQFTQGWYLLEQIDGQVYMYDLRFTTLDPGKYALNFKLHLDENYNLTAERTSPNRHITFKNTVELFKRLAN
ncbi:MAG: metal-dependent hydrolase, partial [Prevotellaceae bacterium]|nr:metal-dependent hydrolase [Prevotellaceae bacterium]